MPKRWIVRLPSGGRSIIRMSHLKKNFIPFENSDSFRPRQYGTSKYSNVSIQHFRWFNFLLPNHHQKFDLVLAQFWFGHFRLVKFGSRGHPSYTWKFSLVLYNNKIKLNTSELLATNWPIEIHIKTINLNWIPR